MPELRVPDPTFCRPYHALTVGFLGWARSSGHRRSPSCPPRISDGKGHLGKSRGMQRTPVDKNETSFLQS